MILGEWELNVVLSFGGEDKWRVGLIDDVTGGGGDVPATPKDDGDLI